MQATSDKGIGSSLGYGGRRFGYLMGAVVNAVLLAVVSGPLVWRIPFLTEDFASVLPIIVLSLTASVVANLVFVIYDAAWFRHLTRVGLSVVAFAATYTMLTVFPFAFDNAGLDVMVRLSLSIALVCTAIAAVVELFQFLFGWIRG